MSIRNHLTTLLVAGGLVCTAFEAAAQGGGGGGGGGGGFGRNMVLDQDQMTQIRDATQNTPELADLNKKLADAQKEALTAALAKDATEASVRPKLEAVAKIQTDIAVLRFTKVVKAVAPSVTDDQKTQMSTNPGGTYGMLFGGGFGGGRGGGRRQGGGGGGGGGGGAN